MDNSFTLPPFAGLSAFQIKYLSAFTGNLAHMAQQSGQLDTTLQATIAEEYSVHD